MQRFRAYSTLTLVVAALFAAPEAHATRMVTYSATGQNHYGGYARADSSSSCSVTITNPSATSQSVTFTMHIVASGTVTYDGSATFTHTITLAPAATAVATNCATGSGSCTFPDTPTLADVASWGTSDFPTITRATAGATPFDQAVLCEGTIKVDDVTAGVPGFINASGTLTTYTESAAGAALGIGGGTSKAITTTPTTTAIVIGEGRAF